MFKLGEHIMYNSQYVCVVDDICDMDMGAQSTSYYVLRPIYERNTTIKIPVGSTKVSMRELISPDEAKAIIKGIPKMIPEWIEDKNLRAQEYKRALRSGCCDEWAKLTKTLFCRKKEVAQSGKKLSSSDEQTLRTAEQLLHGELAIILGISIDEVQEYIADQIGDVIEV